MQTCTVFGFMDTTTVIKIDKYVNTSLKYINAMRKIAYQYQHDS